MRAPNPWRFYALALLASGALYLVLLPWYLEQHLLALTAAALLSLGVMILGTLPTFWALAHQPEEANRAILRGTPLRLILALTGLGVLAFMGPAAALPLAIATVVFYLGLLFLYAGYTGLELYRESDRLREQAGRTSEVTSC